MTARLPEILQYTEERVSNLKARATELEGLARSAPTVPNWVEALSGGEVSVIAEVKRRSPSAGSISRDLVPEEWARDYREGGAAAISVLTEPRFFGGSETDFARIRTHVGLPLLRKDFILDPTQVFESVVMRASAVLLIVRILDFERLAELSALARELGLARLVEVHSGAELEQALRIEPDSVGVNARDLDTFAVDPRIVWNLLPEVPEGVIAVAESGIQSRADVISAADCGADAVLVGTSVARAADRVQAVRDLCGEESRGRRAGLPKIPEGLAEEDPR